MFREMRRVKRIFAIRFTISTDLVERNMIWLVTGITFAVLAVYSFFWIKFKMKMLVLRVFRWKKLWRWKTVCIIQSESGGESGAKFRFSF